MRKKNFDFFEPYKAGPIEFNQNYRGPEYLHDLR